MNFLAKVRTPEKTGSVKKQILITAGIVLFGIFMGTFSKFLDYRQADLPELLQAIDDALDFHNFLGGFSPWIVIAVFISVYSGTPFRAATNVFGFFTGMVASYYIYSNFVAGFFPRSYAVIWMGCTIISPFLAFLCWYAKGKGKFALILSAGIVGFLINTAFAYGMFYIDIRSWLNMLMLILGILILHRTKKETIFIIGAGIVLAIVMEAIVPISIW